jgi:hypothetical protein
VVIEMTEMTEIVVEMMVEMMVERWWRMVIR